MYQFKISTQKRYELIDITEEVENQLKQAKIKYGLVLVFAPHSTCAILLTENEEGLKQDWLALFEKIVGDLDFAHNRIDNNADSHLLSGLVGQGKTLAIENGRLVRGTWQNIFLAEFDGPRERQIIVKILKS